MVIPSDMVDYLELDWYPGNSSMGWVVKFIIFGLASFRFIMGCDGISVRGDNVLIFPMLFKWVIFSFFKEWK